MTVSLLRSPSSRPWRTSNRALLTAAVLTPTCHDLLMVPIAELVALVLAMVPVMVPVMVLETLVLVRSLSSLRVAGSGCYPQLAVVPFLIWWRRLKRSG